MPPEKFDVGENSWLVWSKHVLLQLEQNTKCLAEVKSELKEARLELARLKVKSGVWWGMAGGAVPVVVGIVLWIFQK